jgi:hypothetical protein
MQERPPLSAIETQHYIEIVLPVIHTVIAEHDLAKAGAMYLDAWIVCPNTDRTRIPKDHSSLAAAEYFAASGMISWIETESFRRRASCDESLAKSKR